MILEGGWFRLVIGDELFVLRFFLCVYFVLKSQSPLINLNCYSTCMNETNEIIEQVKKLIANQSPPVLRGKKSLEDYLQVGRQTSEYLIEQFLFKAKLKGLDDSKGIFFSRKIVDDLIIAMSEDRKVAHKIAVSKNITKKKYSGCVELTDAQYNGLQRDLGVDHVEMYIAEYATYLKSLPKKKRDKIKCHATSLRVRTSK